MQATPLFQHVKQTAAAERPVLGAGRRSGRPGVRPALAHALWGAAERLDPNVSIRAVGPPRHGAGP